MDDTGKRSPSLSVEVPGKMYGGLRALALGERHATISSLSPVGGFVSKSGLSTIWRRFSAVVLSTTFRFEGHWRPQVFVQQAAHY